MRTYAYLRINPNEIIDKESYIILFNEMGFNIKKNRLVVEESTVSISINYREKFHNLLTYALEEGDVLIVKSIDALGNCFEEILNTLNIIQSNNIKLICYNFSKQHISGDQESLFLHFLQLCRDFEKEFGASKGDNINKILKKVGRPEILSNDEKNKVIELFQKGCSVYSLAKEFSVTRTVIQRVLDKSKNYN